MLFYICSFGKNASYGCVRFQSVCFCWLCALTDQMFVKILQMQPLPPTHNQPGTSWESTWESSCCVAVWMPQYLGHLVRRMSGLHFLLRVCRYYCLPIVCSFWYLWHVDNFMCHIFVPRTWKHIYFTLSINRGSQKPFIPSNSNTSGWFCAFWGSFNHSS